MGPRFDNALLTSPAGATLACLPQAAHLTSVTQHSRYSGLVRSFGCFGPMTERIRSPRSAPLQFSRVRISCAFRLPVARGADFERPSRMVCILTSSASTTSETCRAVCKASRPFLSPQSKAEWQAAKRQALAVTNRRRCRRRSSSSSVIISTNARFDFGRHRPIGHRLPPRIVALVRRSYALRVFSMSAYSPSAPGAVSHKLPVG